VGEGLVDDASDRVGAGDVQCGGPQAVRRSGPEIVERLGSARVAATRSPRASSCPVRIRPKPDEVPVMNQVVMS
jgi:hypothetical protein